MDTEIQTEIKIKSFFSQERTGTQGKEHSFDKVF